MTPSQPVDQTVAVDDDDDEDRGKRRRTIASSSPSSSSSSSSSCCSIPPAVLDLTEWACHELFASVSPENDGSRRTLTTDRIETLGYFLRLLGSVPDYGRLCTRLGLASFVSEVCGRDAYGVAGRRPRDDEEEAEEEEELEEGEDRAVDAGDGEDGEDNDDEEEPDEGRFSIEKEEEKDEDEDDADRLVVSEIVPLDEATPETWLSWIEKLDDLRKLTLRNDADALVVPEAVVEFNPKSRDDDQSEIAETQALDLRRSIGDESNERLSKRPCFASEYDDLKRRFLTRRAVASFRRDLERIVRSIAVTGEDDPKRREEGRTDDDDDHHDDDKSDVLKDVEQAVDEYKRMLSEIYSNDDASMPKSLMSFLLPDLYGDHRKRGDSSASSDLPEKLMQDLNRATRRSATDDGRDELSLLVLQDKVRQLMGRWEEEALTTPTLVSLGYGKTTTGGSAVPLVPAAAASEAVVDEERGSNVSSWGGSDNDGDDDDTTVDLTQPLTDEPTTAGDDDSCRVAVGSDDDDDKTIEYDHPASMEEEAEKEKAGGKGGGSAEEDALLTQPSSTEEPTTITGDDARHVAAALEDGPRSDERTDAKNDDETRNSSAAAAATTAAAVSPSTTRLSLSSKYGHKRTRGGRWGRRQYGRKRRVTLDSWSLDDATPPAMTPENNGEEEAKREEEREDFEFREEGDISSVEEEKDDDDDDDDRSDDEEEEEEVVHLGRRDRLRSSSIEGRPFKRKKGKDPSSSTKYGGPTRKGGTAARHPGSGGRSRDEESGSEPRSPEADAGPVASIPRRRRIVDSPSEDSFDSDVDSFGSFSSSSTPRQRGRSRKRPRPPPTNPRETTTSPARKKQRRRRFTDEEKDAIKDGVSRFGKGCWKEIRNYHINVLESRTTVNIKDCYRTMLRKGEVVEEDEEEE